MSLVGWGRAPSPKELNWNKRILAWIDLWILDHGFLRSFFKNLYVLDGPMIRCNQPSPGKIAYYTRRYGLKTIINLRGFFPELGRYQLEAEACHRNNVKLINVKLSSRGIPSKERILFLKNVIEAIELPALAHCKSGADRAGLFAVLYCHFRLGQPIDEAKEQLHWTYGHFRSAKTGILDYFFESYIQYRDQWIETHQDKTAPTFLEWVNSEYDRDSMQKEFKPRGFASFWVDWILRRE